MAFRELRYYLSEACKSLWYNRIMTLTSIVTVTGCLLLFGVFMLFSININYIADQVMAQCEVQAFISKDSTDADLQRVKSQIEQLENIEAVEAETQEQAFRNLQEMLGETASGLDDGTFLRPSCIIAIKDLSLVLETVDQIAEIDGVEEVKNRQDIVNGLLATERAVRIGGIIAMIFLSIIAIFIISNTIKLAVHARSREINIMKYVGATDWFIRWPFIIEGIIIGFIGGGIALLLSSLGYNWVISAMTGFLNVFDLKSMSSLIGLLTAALMLFGGFMGAIGSLIAIRRHLKV
ncbi:MAG: permease-like cell division protein FtsX [Clostridia bacterium]|nr:permease-like cell division protein FtsX [Clostridia bacterium]